MADDDQDDWLVIGEAMNEVDPDVELVFAQNGEELVTMLNKHHSDHNLPSLIILDMNMPRLTGTQTLQRIKGDDRFKNIPVIIYSTSVNAIEKTKCFELGAIDYLSKPMSFSESIEIARTMREVF